MRRTLTLLTAGLSAALIAALVVVAVPAEGAPNGGGPGDPLLLSRVNQAGPMTVLKTNGGFRILAKNPKRPPLMVYTPDSVPPLDVSSQAKVANLNVDLLDGLDASAFSRVVHAHDDRYYTETESNARFLQVTDASQLAVPSGAIMYFDATLCPRGWTVYEPARGRFVSGLPAGGTPGGVSGPALSDLGTVTATAGGVHNHVWSIFEGGTRAWKTFLPDGVQLLIDWGDGIDNAGSGIYPLAPEIGAGSGQSVYYTATGGGHTHAVDMPYVQLLACKKD
jgi:hypothetical protein